MTDLADGAERAASLRIAVIGGGMSGLIAARECVKLGIRVTIFEADDHLGGVVRSAQVDDLTLDVGAESFATRGGHVRALVDDLGLGDAVVRPAGGRAWLAGLPDPDAAPLPAGGILGIPVNPFADDVRRIIGWRGAWRAYLDRLRPVLTIGSERSLGTLVRTRLGDRVLDRLVAPVTSGVYSAHPDDIDVDRAAPGLNAALTRTGSLLGAVAAVTGTAAERAREGKAPGSAVEGIDGGMSRLVDALRHDLERFGTEIRTQAPVLALGRDGDHWTVELAADEPAQEELAQGEDAAAAPEHEDEAFDAVIVATHEAAARELLAPVVPGLDAHAASAPPIVEIVTLVLDAPALDAAPRGSGVLTVPGSHTAKALTHSSVKWEWVAREAAGRHVVRVSFGAQGEEPATAALSDDDAAALALGEASRLLGVPLEAAMLRGAHRARFVQAQPGSAIGQVEAARTSRSAVQAVAGLGVVGAWLAGTGLAQVVPDARAEADRVRRLAMWGPPPDAAPDAT